MGSTPGPSGTSLPKLGLQNSVPWGEPRDRVAPSLSKLGLRNSGALRDPVAPSLPKLGIQNSVPRGAPQDPVAPSLPTSVFRIRFHGEHTRNRWHQAFRNSVLRTRFHGENIGTRCTSAGNFKAGAAHPVAASGRISLEWARGCRHIQSRPERRFGRGGSGTARTSHACSRLSRSGAYWSRCR
jgi:hypothetical protein